MQLTAMPGGKIWKMHISTRMHRYTRKSNSRERRLRIKILRSRCPGTRGPLDPWHSSRLGPLLCGSGSPEHVLLKNHAVAFRVYLVNIGRHRHHWPGDERDGALGLGDVHSIPAPRPPVIREADAQRNDAQLRPARQINQTALDLACRALRTAG